MTSTPTKTFAQTPAGQGLGAKSSMLRDIHKSLANTTDALPESAFGTFADSLEEVDC